MTLSLIWKSLSFLFLKIILLLLCLISIIIHKTNSAYKKHALKTAATLGRRSSLPFSSIPDSANLCLHNRGLSHHHAFLCFFPLPPAAFWLQPEQKGYATYNQFPGSFLGSILSLQPDGSSSKTPPTGHPDCQQPSVGQTANARPIPSTLNHETQGS